MIDALDPRFTWRTAAIGFGVALGIYAAHFLRGCP
jgi:hypothetical protein